MGRRAAPADGATVDVRRLARRSLVVIALLYVAVCATVFVQQDRLIYAPPGSAPSLIGQVDGIEAVEVVADDGVVLPAWWLPINDPGGAGPVAVVLHGIGSTRSDSWPLAVRLHAAGASVLLAEYRGFGGAPGRPSEQGLVRDGIAAVAWVRDRPEVDPSQITLIGDSLGTAVAIQVAGHDDVRAVVLRSPFTSMSDVARRQARWLPVDLLLRDRWESLEHAGEVTAPVLVALGDADQLVPPAQSRAVAEALAGPRAVVVLAGADHDDPRWHTDADYMDAVAAMVRTGELPPDR